MNKILTITAIALVAMLGLASCSSSAADLRDDFASTLEADGFPMNDDIRAVTDDYVDCLISKAGYKNVRNGVDDPTAANDRLDKAADDCEEDEDFEARITEILDEME